MTVRHGSLDSQQASQRHGKHQRLEDEWLDKGGRPDEFESQIRTLSSLLNKEPEVKPEFRGTVCLDNFKPKDYKILK